MIWEHPQLLWILVVPLLLFAAGWYIGVRRKKRVRKFFSAEMIGRLSTKSWSRGRKLKHLFLYPGLALLIIGMAGPKIGSEIREVKREGVDLLVILDVSRSMLAEDVRPNRLNKAKFEISSLVDRLQGDRIGLILFTNQAFLQSPLTTDYSAFRMYLDLATTDQFPHAGTDFRAPLREAARVFEDRPQSARDAAKVVLLFSDGENHSPDFEQEMNRLREQNVNVYTVGIGSLSGAPVPVFDNSGRAVGNLRDRSGSMVTTRLEPDNLRRIAEIGKGSYYEIRRGNDRIDGFISQLAELERREFASERFSDYANRYQYPTAAGLLLVVISMMIPAYRKPIENRA